MFLERSTKGQKVREALDGFRTLQKVLEGSGIF